MSKLLATVSAIGLAALIALLARPARVSKTGASMKNSNSIEVSSARRHYRGTTGIPTDTGRITGTMAITRGV